MPSITINHAITYSNTVLYYSKQYNNITLYHYYLVLFCESLLQSCVYNNYFVTKRFGQFTFLDLKQYST